jgi:hypothetical protein
MPDNGKPSKRVVQKPKGPKPALQVVGGAKPTGKLPKVVGAGIFGLPGQDEGVFSSDAKPIAAAGIFFNPYAVTNIAMEQPSTSWTLLRRPGQPLYPGSSARGIVLIGPSMGDNGDGNGEQQAGVWGRPLLFALIGAAGAYAFWKLILEGK